MHTLTVTVAIVQTLTKPEFVKATTTSSGHKQRKRALIEGFENSNFTHLPCWLVSECRERWSNRTTDDCWDRTTSPRSSGEWPWCPSSNRCTAATHLAGEACDKPKKTQSNSIYMLHAIYDRDRLRRRFTLTWILVWVSEDLYISRQRPSRISHKPSSL